MDPFKYDLVETILMAFFYIAGIIGLIGLLVVGF